MHLNGRELQVMTVYFSLLTANEVIVIQILITNSTTVTTKIFFSYFLSPMIILLNAPGVLPAPSIHSLPALHIPKLSRTPSTNPFSSNPKNLSYLPPTSRPRPGIQEPPFPPDGNRIGPPSSRVCSHVSQLGQNRLQVLAQKARSQLGASLTPHAVGEVR